MKPGAKKQTLLWVGAIALSAGVFTTLAYYQMRAMASTAKHVLDLRAQIDGEGDVQAQLEQINLKVEDSKEKLTHLEQGVPPTAYVPTMMTELETIGEQNGITVTGVRPILSKAPPQKTDADGKPMPDRKPYNEENLEVKGTGHYMNVLSFLASLQTFPKIVAVTQVTLMPVTDTKNPSTSNLEITVELRAFLFKESAPMLTKDKLAQGAHTSEGI